MVYGLGLLHEDVRAIRSTVEGHAARLDAIDRRLDSIDGNVGEILRRLPAE